MRPEPIKTNPTCSHCGNELTTGGTAILCGATGGMTLDLPRWCDNKQCRRERDDIAIERAIAAGIITQ